jgi:hypothetical protein
LTGFAAETSPASADGVESNKLVPADLFPDLFPDTTDLSLTGLVAETSPSSADSVKSKTTVPAELFPDTLLQGVVSTSFSLPLLLATPSIASIRLITVLDEPTQTFSRFCNKKLYQYRVAWNIK